MLRFGRYGIAFGRTAWFQTKAPARLWHFLWFWFFKEARRWDVDHKQQFPLNTPMEHEGRVYRYWKAGEDIVVHHGVKTGREALDKEKLNKKEVIPAE